MDKNKVFRSSGRNIAGPIAKINLEYLPVLHLLDLTKTETSLFWFLLRNMDYENHIYMKGMQLTYAIQLNITQQNISKALLSLVKKKVVVVLIENDKKEYYLNSILVEKGDKRNNFNKSHIDIIDINNPKHVEFMSNLSKSHKEMNKVVVERTTPKRKYEKKTNTFEVGSDEITFGKKGE